MFVAACKERDMPDMEFFLNKRDHPQLKRDLTEPYDFIFLNEKGDKPPPLTRTKFKSYAPIFSYYVGKKFAHGYLTLAPGTIFTYAVEGDYNPDSECSIIWKDIPQIKTVVLSHVRNEDLLHISYKDKNGK